MADDIKVFSKGLERLTKELKGFEKEIGRAFFSAVNRTIDHTLTVTARTVSKTYNIKQADIKAGKGSRSKLPAVTVYVNRPSGQNPGGSVEFVGRTLTLMHFHFSPKKAFPLPKRTSREKTVKVKIKHSGGTKKLHTGPPPFVYKFSTNQNTNVWRRTGKKLYPIEPIRTVSVPQMITNANVADTIIRSAAQMLDERMEHEIIRQMTSIGRKVRG
ncbi:MAG: phage tail protein [bacterium]|jgi:hypothetical protein